MKSHLQTGYTLLEGLYTNKTYTHTYTFCSKGKPIEYTRVPCMFYSAGQNFNSGQKFLALVDSSSPLSPGPNYS